MGETPAVDREGLREARELLREADYTDGRIVETLQGEGLTRPDAKLLHILDRRTSGGSRLEDLIRLFILGLPIALDRATKALSSMSAERWAELGLLTIDGDQVRGTIQLRAYRDMIVGFDFATDTEVGFPTDYVMGISASTIHLAGLAIRRPVASTLDLGTGSGFQALLAAEHSERVTATDTNPRALHVTALNAGLNGIDIECLEGSLFEPVEGRTFDLILSNPPFIVAPAPTHQFLHGGGQGDDTCHALARLAPAHLVEGGICQFLANWAVVEGQPFEDRMAEWFEGSGCDVWVMHRGPQGIEQYAHMWIETGSDPAVFGREFDDWMRFFERERIEAIDTGVVTMRRRDGGDNWLRVDDAPDSVAYPWSTGSSSRR